MKAREIMRNLINKLLHYFELLIPFSLVEGGR